MVEGIYGFLESVGWTHPLHPAMVHAPMGLIIGMLVFGVLALKWTDRHFAVSAYYCSVLAFLTIFPTIVTGLLDWQYRYFGELNYLIITKLIVSVVLTILLLVAIVLRNKGISQPKLVIVYLLCMACTGILGYSGGELVYGG